MKQTPDWELPSEDCHNTIISTCEPVLSEVVGLGLGVNMTQDTQVGYKHNPTSWVQTNVLVAGGGFTSGFCLSQGHVGKGGGGVGIQVI